MALLSAIFAVEWRKLVRSRLMTGSLVFFSIIALSAIRTGQLSVQYRIQQLDSIRTACQRDYQQQWNIITDSSAEGRKKAATEGLAALVNYRLPQPALWYPRALQHLSIGITDIQPSYHLVQTSINFIDPPNMPVNNPVKLFAGNFDLAFVWLYILPLLIIVFCYPVYAEEKESGTVRLLSLQSGNLRLMISLKLLFRLLIISCHVQVLNIAGFLAIPGKLNSDFGEMMQWCCITQLYLLIWVSLSWLVASFRMSSALSLLLLTGCWLVAVMIAPALTNIYAAARYPAILRTELASLQRHESEEIWSTSPSVLVDSFNTAYPQFNSLRDPAKDTVFGSNRFVAGYYHLLEKRVGKAASELNSRLQLRNEYFARLAGLNPVLQTQQLFNQLAGSSLQDYQEYRNQVNVFQGKWKAFLLPFQVSEKPLGATEFRQFPVFNDVRSSPATVTRDTILYLLIFLPAIAGFFLFNRKEEK